MTHVIGIDPGVSGGVAFYDGAELITLPMPRTEVELANQLRGSSAAWAVVEKVASSPQMGVRSAFTFGQGYGRIEGVLAALEIPSEHVRPQDWMRALGIAKKTKTETQADYKRRLKAIADRMFPGHKLTMSTCDAALLAVYAWRHVLRWDER